MASPESVQMVGNDTGIIIRKGTSTKIRTAIRLFWLGQIAGDQGALDDILVGAPVRMIGKHHTGEQRGEWRGVFRPADGVEFVGIG